MLTYRQFLTESASVRHVAEQTFRAPGWFFEPVSSEDYDIPKGSVYYQNDQGQLSREDGPALECLDGFKMWYKDGKLHKVGGPACIWPDGEQMWYQNGEMHREDGPAMEMKRTKDWFTHGSRVTDGTSDEDKWLLLKGNPESIRRFPNGSTKEMQEYLLKVRPDLISVVQNLDPEVAEKFKHEVEFGHVDL